MNRPDIRELLKPELLDGVSITAVCDNEGSFSHVSKYSVQSKISAALSKSDVTTLMLCTGQQNDSQEIQPKPIARGGNQPDLRILTAENLEQAVRQLYYHSLPRRKWIEKQRKNAVLQLIDGTIIEWSYYVKTSLLPYFEKESSDSEGKKQSEEKRQAGFDDMREDLKAFDEDDLISLDQMIKSFINEMPYYLILDNSGQGKSTLLKYQVHQIAEHTSSIPVMIDCYDWQESQQTLEQYIKSQEGYNDQWFGESVLLLDQLDVLNTKKLDEIINCLQELKEKNCGIIVTSRDDGRLKQSQHIFKLLKAYHLQPWSWAQKCQYIKDFPVDSRHHHVSKPSKYDPDKIIRHIQQDTNISGLTESPLVLSLMNLYALKHNSLPERRCELYNSLFEELLTLSHLDRGEIVKADIKSGNETYQSILAQTAFELYFISKTKFSVDDFSQAYQRAENVIKPIGSININATHAYQDLLDIRLLKKSETLQMEFFHPTMHEFLCGKAVARQLNEGWNKITVADKIEDKAYAASIFIKAKIWDRQWEKILIFIAGFLDEPEHLFYKFFYHKIVYKPLLYQYCLFELQNDIRVQYTSTVNYFAEKDYKLFIKMFEKSFFWAGEKKVRLKRIADRLIFAIKLKAIIESEQKTLLEVMQNDMIKQEMYSIEYILSSIYCSSVSE